MTPDLAVLIAAAFLLDLLLGDPAWLPHPVRAIGYLAGGLEAWSRRVMPAHLKAAGFVTVIMVLTVTWGVARLMLFMGAAVHPLLFSLISLYLLYASLAAHDLAWHAGRVSAALESGDLPLARQRLAMIVGRDTGELTTSAVCKACVESVAENIVDGFTAPLFWAVIFGPIGAIVYKAVNTMDSMFGYKNERYRKFGFAAARLDDLANFIPARLSALLMVAASLIGGYNAAGAWRIWRRDHGCHASPNSAHSEAAAAGALGLRLGGDSRYFGKIVVKPVIGDAVDECRPRHIRAVIRLLYITAVIAVLLAVSVCLGR
ncbi:MAG TPA: cobalamin biosynthesis protein CobD [Desulfobacterales bacterium]|nr:cobalamin biosynthesis protein CobD [Desulfobacterales bacterium]